LRGEICRKLQDRLAFRLVVLLMEVSEMFRKLELPDF